MTKPTLSLSGDQLISDYRLAYCSRQAVIISRRMVLHFEFILPPDLMIKSPSV